MKGAERQERRGKKRRAKSKMPTEVTGKVVISSRKWGIKSGQVPWRRDGELSLRHALFEVSKTPLGEVK